MRKNFGPKPYMYPLPVLIIGSYDGEGNANAMTAAWGGLADSNKVVICVDASHKTIKNITETGAFTVSFANKDNVKQADYVGIISGNEESDKVATVGWHTTHSEFVNAPLFDELPVAMECELISYDYEFELMFGEIMNVCVDECVLDSDGKLDVGMFAPIVYDSMNHGYYTLGEKVGRAFKDGLDLKKEE
ncbi:MAG: flavin reductase family protein [Erysipelotrichaceae bacterium]|nr:flavin reductase family protein [Erysipelotrichaceae bacterium]